MSERVYRVVATREGDDWLADVPDAPPAHTFARNLESLDRYVREAVVLAEDLPDESMGSLQLAWEFHTGDEALDMELARLRAERDEVAQSQARLEDDTARLAGKLSGFSVRDAGALLGVSRSRAQQLRAS